MDEHINSLIGTRDKLRAGLMSTTPNYGGDIVDGTRDPHKYDGLVAMEDMIDREIDRLYDIKQEILAVVLQMQDTRYRDVLMKRYVDIDTWEQIAVEMHYSYMHVCRLHGEALKAAEAVIPMQS
jgi:DNA-directed RNA polymerase specialized sigma subunit